MKNTLTSLTVMMVREGRQLNGFLAGLARREDASKLRAVVLNMPVAQCALWLSSFVTILCGRGHEPQGPTITPLLESLQGSS